ncbi:MAG: hypothetical protein E7I42_11600 [Pluralibacter gergoviae]|nr:hypothetical protein [Pluralibacter gergoviae]MDU4433534.1 hypothetical protein [Pluralibacter gergoviae]
MFNPLDNKKALAVFPFYSGTYEVPAYIKPGTNVIVKVESREQELAILAAYDYGVDALSEEGKEQISRLIADLKVAITGR